MWSLHKLHAKRHRPDVHETVDDPSSSLASDASLVSPWGFSQDDLERFPALTRRNFWCIQRHQATALHYDLRMQLDGATFSWAIPRGLLGMSKEDNVNRLAVETTLHPISYTTYEGSDGRTLPSGERGGTLLWDVGTYTISYPWRGHGADSDSDNEQERRRKKRKSQAGSTSIFQEDNSDDPTGRFEEDKFRQALTRRVGHGKSRSIHFVLKGGYKMTNHHYILILSPGKTFGPSFSSDGRVKKTWIIRLPKGVDGYPWGKGGEEGDESGRSVKSGKTLIEVCHGLKVGPRIWSTEAKRFASWKEDEDDAPDMTTRPLV